MELESDDDASLTDRARKMGRQNFIYTGSAFKPRGDDFPRRGPALSRLPSKRTTQAERAGTAPHIARRDLEVSTAGGTVMITQDHPFTASPGRTFSARVGQRRAVRVATFRFAAAPRFEMVRAVGATTENRRRWLRIGTPGTLAAFLLGQKDWLAANDATAAEQRLSVASEHHSPSPLSKTSRTAVERPRHQWEMEPRHDTYGGVFADWPDPGGT